MVKLTVLYPNADGSRFDMDYYLATHIPLVNEKVGPACRSITVDQGLAGAMPGEPAPYATICNVTFDSIESFQDAFGPAAPDLLADISNFTDIEPTIQVSETKL